MDFHKRKALLNSNFKKLIEEKNEPIFSEEGFVTRYKNPVITNKHIPLDWQYDFDQQSNPHLLQRIGINAAFNAGAIDFEGKICLMVRVEGWDRKSFFAVARSENGVDNFVFDKYPIMMPEIEAPDTNIYDMRLTKHEDGWMYGVFCTERKDPNAGVGDFSSAIALAGIARTKDLIHWERLQDLQTPSPQQRNVTLHPEFVDGKYAFYTRPMNGFIGDSNGGGIAWGLSNSIENAKIEEELVIEDRRYHTVSELKNGQGPTPIKTSEGWIHLAHGVRNTVAGMRYILYMYVTALNDPTKIIYRPAGYFMAPQGEERIGDVSNVLFTNGWVVRNGEVFIYYGSSDTRLHVAKSSIELLLDYCKNTPEDGLKSSVSVQKHNDLIRKNENILNGAAIKKVVV